MSDQRASKVSFSRLIARLPTVVDSTRLDPASYRQGERRTAERITACRQSDVRHEEATAQR